MAYPTLGDLIRDLTGLDLPLPIPMFGLLVATALLISLRLLESELRRMHAVGRVPMARRRARSSGGAREYVDVPAYELMAGLALTIVAAGIVGARVFHLLEYPEAFLADQIGRASCRERVDGD